MPFNWTKKETEVSNLNDSDREKYRRLKEDSNVSNENYDNKIKLRAYEDETKKLYSEEENNINNLKIPYEEKKNMLKELKNEELNSIKSKQEEIRNKTETRDKLLNNLRIQRQEQAMLNKAQITPKKTYIQLPTSSKRFEREEVGKPKINVVRGVKGFFKQKETERLPGTNKLGYSMLGFGQSNEQEQIKNNILGWK